MNASYKIRAITLILLCIAVLSACATKNVSVEGYSPTVDVSGLERDDSEAPSVIYTRPGAPDLGEFNRFIIDPVQGFYDDPKMEELSPQQIARMQQDLRDARIR